MNGSGDLQAYLLTELRDVHLPPAVAWWPPAPGWWWVAGLAAIVLAAGGAFFWRRRTANRYRHQALRECAESYRVWEADQKTADYVNRSNRVLRRVAIRLCGREAVAARTGAAWIELLNRLSPQPLPDSVAEALSEYGYRRDARANIDQIHADLTGWLKRHRGAARV